MTKYGRPARLASAEDARAALFEAIRPHAPQLFTDLAGDSLARFREWAESRTPEAERALEDAVREWRARWRLTADWWKDEADERLAAWADGTAPPGQWDLMASSVRAWPDDRSCFEIEGETITASEPEDPTQRERWQDHMRWLEARGRSVEDLTLRLTPAQVWWYAMAWHPEDGEARAEARARLTEWAARRVDEYLDRIEEAATKAGLEHHRELRVHAELFVRRRLCGEGWQALADSLPLRRGKAHRSVRAVQRAVAAFARLVEVDV